MSCFIPFRDSSQTKLFGQIEVSCSYFKCSYLGGGGLYPEEISTSPLGEGLFLKRTVGMEIPENAFELLEGHVDKMDDRTVVGSTNAARTNIMPGQLDAIARGVRGSRISCRHHDLESYPIVSPIPSFPQVMRTR